MKTRSRGAPLGQHLLTNPRVAAHIAEAAVPKAGTLVLEVGPGKGALTAELLKRGAAVTAIEKDPKMLEYLRETFKKEIASKKLSLISGDARDIDPGSLFKKYAYTVAANIPYYATGELIRLFLTTKHQPTTITLLVQKEVAERIARSKKESILSLSVKVFGNPQFVETVKRGNFTPPPTVDSAVLHISDISRERLNKISEEKFFSLVKAGFGQKRKTLAGNLKRALGYEVVMPSGTRAEDVPLSEWLRLAKELE